MRHFEGMVLQNLEEINHSENGRCFLKKFEGQGSNLSFRSVQSIGELNALAGQLWHMESALVFLAVGTGSRIG